MTSKQQTLKNLLQQDMTARAIRRKMSQMGFDTSEYSDVQLTNMLLDAKKSLEVS